MTRHLKILPLIAAAAGLLWMTAAIACDDHVGKCKIEEWRSSYTAVMRALTIDGVATCDAGVARIRLYEGEGDARKFLGVETAYIEGHIFKAFVLDVAKPRTLSIKSSIEPR